VTGPCVTGAKEALINKRKEIKRKHILFKQEIRSSLQTGGQEFS
jgi:hypothetical protein